MEDQSPGAGETTDHSRVIAARCQEDRWVSPVTACSLRPQAGARRSSLAPGQMLTMCRVHATNGTWQDGCTLLEQDDGNWIAFLNKCSAQSYETDDNGDPL